MPATIYAFLSQDQIGRAVTVMEIALGRGLAYDRAMYFAVESLGEDPRTVGDHVWRLVEAGWRRRRQKLAV